MSDIQNGHVNEEKRFDDIIRFSGARDCEDHEDTIREIAASLILAKVNSKANKPSHLICCRNYLSFCPEISENNYKIEGKILLQEIRGFYVSQRHPKSLVILFQRSESPNVTLYGIVLSSSEKARKLTMLLSEPNTEQVLPREQSNPKMKSVVISPKVHAPQTTPLKDSNDTPKTYESLKALPPSGNRFRSEFKWNKTGKQQYRGNYSPSSPAVQVSGRLANENHQSEIGKHQVTQPKSGSSSNTQTNTYDCLSRYRQDLSTSTRHIPPKTFNHVSFQQPVTRGVRLLSSNYQMPHHNSPSRINSESYDEGGCDTPFPYDPNENVEAFSIGYYNNEDDSKVQEYDIFHLKGEQHTEVEDPVENPWVENITYISSNRNGGAAVTSNGPIYLYVAQQVNPRFEVLH
ncbi:unnamed protein product [Heterobilharzia americana]|nr:unnamed protein product [Heterobilharzia americana]